MLFSRGSRRVAARLFEQTEDLGMFDAAGWFWSWLAKRGLDSTWDRICNWYRTEAPRKVVILGPGGVGKSTLAQFLAGFADDGPTGEYHESTSVERYPLNDDKSVQIVVLPGQPHRMAATWTDVLEELRAGAYRGVILQQAYGHHAIGDFSYKNHTLFKASKNLKDFLSKYVAHQLVEEERVLNIISAEIRKCAHPIWLLTLVTKQDLWWDERDTVENYYTSGKYSEILRECLGSKEPHHFRHETAFVSLVIRNLMTGREELLKHTAAGYDQPTQVASIERLLKIFEGLMEWERKNG